MCWLKDMTIQYSFILKEYVLRKETIFPKICKKYYIKAIFFPQNKGLIHNTGQNYSFLVVSANVMSNRNSFTVESCVTRKISNISRNL